MQGDRASVWSQEEEGDRRRRELHMKSFVIPVFRHFDYGDAIKVHNISVASNIYWRRQRPAQVFERNT